MNVKKKFYNENFDYNYLKNRRKKFETSRVGWFSSFSPNQEYDVRHDTLDKLGKNEVIDYLDEPLNDNTDFVKTLDSRHSTLLNKMKGDWSDKDLKQLLRISIGDGKRTRNTNGDEYLLRNYPSGGGLFPIKLYLIINGDSFLNFKKGVYYVSPDIKKIVRISDDSKYDFGQLFPMSKFKLDSYNDSVANVSFCLSMVMNVKYTFVKYGELAERLAFFEAGHLAQNFLLSSEYLNHEALPVCGQFSDEIERALKIRESDDDYSIYSILFG